MTVIRYENEGPVTWVTIDREAARNTLNASVRTGLLEAFDRFNADTDAAVLVLTGAGTKAFCAGGDLKEMAEERLTVPPPDYVPQPGRTVKVDKPVIGAINGKAFAGGFLLAQQADLLVAAESAEFAITEARVGRGSPWAAPLPRMLPEKIAMELLLTGEPLSANRALELGFVNRVVPDDTLHTAEQDLAEKIAANAPLSVRAAKELITITREHHLTEAYSHAEDLYAPVYESADAQEGPRAFSEKRRPVWTNASEQEPEAVRSWE